MNLGFIILAHNQPESIRRLVDILATGGHRVVIHFDSSATKADLDAVGKIAAERPGQISLISKEHCVWGEWSLVEAVLHALREFEKMPAPPDYIHLMSGADFPIRPITDFMEFLRRNPDLDFIECCDISQKAWVKGGLGKERFRFYFPFNFRTHRKSFDRMVRWQRKLRIRRKLPLDLHPHMGSQWWTLRWSTCKKVLDFTKAHPEVPRYFKSTWIPDESYFQTVIAKLVPRKQIADLQLMFHQLTSAGRPYVFYNDHLSILRKLPHFFARKISPDASVIWNEIYQPDRNRRIPNRRLLSKARDIVRARINENHLFRTNVPGYYQDKVPVVARSTDDSMPMVQKGMTLSSGVTRPVILLFLEDQAGIDHVGKMVGSNPALCWLGRPYAPSKIQMPAEQLARMGLKAKSYRTRDAFSRQFIRYLVEATPEQKIPVIAILPMIDHPDLETFGKINLLLPLLITYPGTKTHMVSLIRAALYELSPQALARTINIDVGQLSETLQAASDDAKFNVHSPAKIG